MSGVSKLGSERRDMAGYVERPSFFGPGPEKLFGCLHSPESGAGAGIVVCCPLQAELLRNYRREVLLARAAAARGIAVQRFHYRGAGHSDGDTSEVTIDSMVDDALAAADHLVARAGVSTVAFAGTRFGGLVAALARAQWGGPLVLWEPVTDPGRYFDEILRFKLMYEMKRNPGASPTEADLVHRLRHDGAVDVLGHNIDLALYDSASGRTLPELEGDDESSALIVQIGIARSLRRDYARLLERWRENGAAVKGAVVHDREAWWLSGDLWPVHETHAATAQVIATSVEWAACDFGRQVSAL